VGPHGDDHAVLAHHPGVLGAGAIVR
jgi:hypothetical protein